jgi:hypothetical protein
LRNIFYHPVTLVALVVEHQNWGYARSQTIIADLEFLKLLCRVDTKECILVGLPQQFGNTEECCPFKVAASQSSFIVAEINVLNWFSYLAFH